ncbi:MAG: viologen exporter family transport system ATP-binding protein [Kosmotogales bacterium]|nr:viologen exporter family transport system ATP-binding protein [Kosmotogales bacterium]
MSDYIEVKKLCKTYTVYKRKKLRREKRLIEAVKDVNFNVKRGEFLGYIGPNGAGKSTTIKMLTGILTPTSGEASVAGYCPWKHRKAYVRNLGAIFGQKTQLWWDLPVKDSYAVLKAMYKVPDGKFRNQLNYLVERLEITEFYSQPVRQLSLGQRMRAELAASLIHDPEILFLDEPTIGLDVVSKHGVLKFLRELNENGKTIFLTTHDLNDIETLCKEILIINHGKLIYKGTLSDLKKMAGLPRLLKIRLKEDSFRLNEEQKNILDDYSGYYNEENREITLKLFDSQNPAELAKILFQKFHIEDFKIQEPGIEEVVKDIYRN